MENTKTNTQTTIDSEINEDIKETVTHVLSRELYEGPKIGAKIAKVLTLVLFFLTFIGITIWWVSHLDPHAVVTDAFLQNRKIYFFNNCQLSQNLQCVEHFFYDKGVIMTLRNNAVSTLTVEKVIIGNCVYDKTTELVPQQLATITLLCPGLSNVAQFTVTSLNPSSGLSTEKIGEIKSKVEITNLYKSVDKVIRWSHNLINPYLT